MKGTDMVGNNGRIALLLLAAVLVGSSGGAERRGTFRVSIMNCLLPISNNFVLLVREVGRIQLEELRFRDPEYEQIGEYYRIHDDIDQLIVSGANRDFANSLVEMYAANPISEK